MRLEMENYCTKCGGVIETECDPRQFYLRRAGRVVCPWCGTVNMPCNECTDHSACAECPYEEAEIINQKGEGK